MEGLVSTTIDNRVSPRETTVDNQTYVQIMEWEGMPITRGRLLTWRRGSLDTSRESVCGPYRPLWIRLERALEIGWVAADVARFDGPQKVAVQFRSLCPLEFFLAATLCYDVCPAAGREEETPSTGEVRTVGCSLEVREPV